MDLVKVLARTFINEKQAKLWAGDIIFFVDIIVNTRTNSMEKSDRGDSAITKSIFSMTCKKKKKKKSIFSMTWKVELT